MLFMSSKRTKQYLTLIFKAQISKTDKFIFVVGCQSYSVSRIVLKLC